MFGCSAPFAVLMGLGMWSLPESPRWLLLRAVQGKGPLQEFKEKAIVALRKLRGGSVDEKSSEKQIEEALVSLKSAYAGQETEGSFLEVFQGSSLKAFIIGGGLVLFQQVDLPPLTHISCFFLLQFLTQVILFWICEYIRSLGSQVFCTMPVLFFRYLSTSHTHTHTQKHRYTPSVPELMSHIPFISVPI